MTDWKAEFDKPMSLARFAHLKLFPRDMIRGEVFAYNKHMQRELRTRDARRLVQAKRRGK